MPSETTKTEETVATILRRRNYTQRERWLWQKPNGSTVAVHVFEKSLGVKKLTEILQKHGQEVHVILVCDRISYVARNKMNEAGAIFEHWVPHMVDIMTHKDVPAYEKGDAKNHPKKNMYRKLNHRKDPVCKILYMRPGEVWWAKFNFPGVGIVREPRFII